MEHRPAQVFYSYAHEDTVHVSNLNSHLSLLQRQDIISIWSDLALEAGEDWNKKIVHYLEAADLILLMISADFIASDFCYGVELKRAMQRHDERNARVIPVIVRPCDWEPSPFSKLQVLPPGGKPVTTWGDIDAAWTAVAKGIRRILTDETSATLSTGRKSWQLRVLAAIDELDINALNKIRDFLRSKSGDEKLTIESVIKGSVVLRLDISEAGQKALEDLINNGELVELLGFKILGYAEYRRSSESKKELEQTGQDTFSKVKPLVYIGAIGHEGHGKTTLTSAITKVMAKRNPTVQFVAFDRIDTVPETTHVEYETAHRRYMHIDCPSHADYVKYVITGTAQMDGAILVVAATEGPMPQTRVHILLARQVGVPAMVVFMNKVEMVHDPELLDLMELEVRELLSAYDFPGDEIPVVRGSALKALEGDPEWEKTVDELMAAVDSYIPTPERDIEKPFLMAVEDIFTIHGRGTAVTGRIERGKVKINDVVEIVGIRPTRSVVVTGIQMFRQLSEAVAGDNVGLLLGGIERKDIERGQVIAQPGSIMPHTKFKAETYMLTKGEGGGHTPFFTGHQPQFFFRTTQVTGVAHLPAGVERVTLGEHVVMDIELTSPIALEKGLHFVIRDTGRMVGAGVVTEVVE